MSLARPLLAWSCTVAWLVFAPAGHARDSIWDGVYTQAQAERGADAYRTNCASCHGEDLRGDSNTPSIAGISFTFMWADRTLSELYDSIATAMPPTNPGGLGDATYVDALAYLLQANGFPAGSDGLSSAEARQRVAITDKP